MKLVIFDCDGTLIDSQHNITAAMTHAFAAHGLPPPPAHDVLSVVGLSLTEAFGVLAPGEPADMRRSLAEHYRNAHTEGRLQRQDEPLYPGIRETIAALADRGDTLLGIATGKSRRGVARLLERERWHGTFMTIQTADDHPSKPHPSMIMAALAEAGVNADATVMVGDTSFDMTMARNASVGALGVSWGYHRPDLLVAAGAHSVVSAGAELIAAIDVRLEEQAAVAGEAR
jgi:phosphoglycolate phosphatase